MSTHLSLDVNINRLPLISYGASGTVIQASDTVVIKRPLPLPNCKEQIDIERRVYDRLGQHPCVTKFLGVYKGMLVLERLQCPLRKRLWDLRDENRAPTPEDVVRWSLQTCKGLEHVHSCKVFQVDISPANVLLDWEDNAKLSDFAGSSIDGSAPLVLPSLHSEHPRWPSSNPTIRSELFALGSTLYEIETTTKPYHDKDDSQVSELFRRDLFPGTENMVLGQTIQNCWFGRYRDVSEVVKDIQQVQDCLEVPPT